MPPSDHKQFVTPEEERALLGWIINSTDDWIWSVDAKSFGLLSFNESLRLYFLNKRDIVIARGMRPDDLFPAGSPLIDSWKGYYQQAIDAGHCRTEYEVYAGTNVLALNLNRLERDGEIIGISVFAKDTTKEWQARRQLEIDRRHAIELQARQALILNTIPQSVFWKDLQGRYLGCNIGFAHGAGLGSPDEIIGKTDFDLPWPEKDAKAYRADDQAVIASGQPRLHIKEQILQANGSRIHADTSKIPLIDSDGVAYGVVGVYEDISERMQAEEALQRTTRTLRTLSAGNEALVHASHEDELLEQMVRIIVTAGDYAMAWVGYAENDTDQSVREVAGYADNGVHPVHERQSWADNALGQSPAGKAVRTGKAQLVRDIQANMDMAPWHGPLTHAGFISGLALPLTDGARVFGVLNIYARESQAFEPGELALLEELANDLAYGIVNLRREQERNKAGERLRRSLEQTIGVIAATVESRDPSTAGHQRRVAELATAIATEMELPPATIEGIRFGALIHDMGNMQVPAGILARPGRLASVEFELIKVHPQIGFEIIKDIDFPWPVATMIHQHHERLDGSGYPLGLRGDEISLEARIIGVADVVEAMMSHRPYRPRLTLDQALAEIIQHRGQRFDARVVDACVRLWREKHFAFGSTPETPHHAPSAS